MNTGTLAAFLAQQKAIARYRSGMVTAGMHREARIIDGKALAKGVRKELKQQVAELTARGVTPGLAVVLVGDDPASAVYVRNKTRACQRIGVAHFDHRFDASLSQQALEGLIEELNRDRRVHGILVQLPLPRHLDADVVLRQIDPAKDVDGFHPENVGRLVVGRRRFVPCTPLGVMHMLRSCETQLSGAHAVVVGRSAIVGKPMAHLLLDADATVTICHSRTNDLPQVVAAADVVVAAVGRPEMIRGQWIKPGATVVDVGINRRGDVLVGDVDFDGALSRAAAISPVPGGVGPMTIAMLLQNTVQSARDRLA